MFKDLGRKIQLCAYIITLLGIIASIVYGIYIWILGVRVGKGLIILFGILIIIIGSLVSWLGSFLLYGFGIIVQSHEDKLEDSQVVEKNLEQPTQENFWVCYYCGAKLNEKSCFCPNCGSEFKEEKPSQTSIDYSFLSDSLSAEEFEKVKKLLSK